MQWPLKLWLGLALLMLGACRQSEADSLSSASLDDPEAEALYAKLSTAQGANYTAALSALNAESTHNFVALDRDLSQTSVVLRGKTYAHIGKALANADYSAKATQFAAQYPTLKSYFSANGISRRRATAQDLSQLLDLQVGFLARWQSGAVSDEPNPSAVPPHLLDAILQLGALHAVSTSTPPTASFALSIVEHVSDDGLFGVSLGLFISNLVKGTKFDCTAPDGIGAETCRSNDPANAGKKICLERAQIIEQGHPQFCRCTTADGVTKCNLGP